MPTVPVFTRFRSKHVDVSTTTRERLWECVWSIVWREKERGPGEVLFIENIGTYSVYRAFPQPLSFPGAGAPGGPICAMPACVSVCVSVCAVCGTLQADLKEHTICTTIRIAPIAMAKTTRRAVLYPSLWFGNHTFNRYASLPFR